MAREQDDLHVTIMPIIRTNTPTTTGYGQNGDGATSVQKGQDIQTHG